MTLCGRVVAALAVDAAAEVVDDHLRATGGQVERVGAAQAAAGTGHDRDAAVEVDVTQGGALQRCGLWGASSRTR
jgi:hypothetical protein